MVNNTTTVLEPTFTGYVATTHDALILFEACLTGVLHHVPRRPHDRERSHLVRSGSVFIYEENSSGIKRWTDGVTWSPSRILGNFLVYRELDKPFPPGEKKRAMKKGSRRPGQTRPGEPYPRPESNGSSISPSPGSGSYSERPPPTEVERALVGSLVDSYGFKDSGLVKKTMSVTVSGVTHHLVSYYSVEDVLKGVLQSPSSVESLRYIRPRPELTKQSFRAPIDDADSSPLSDAHHHNDQSQALYTYRPLLPPQYTIPQQPHDYYVHGNPYGPQVQYPGALPPQSASHPYMHSPPPPSQSDQSSFRANPYYGAMSQNHLHSPIANSMNTQQGGDRNRSQQSSPSAQRTTSLPQRNPLADGSSESPASAASYPRTNPATSGSLDVSSSQPVEQRSLAPQGAYDTTRREPSHVPAPYYTGGLDRQNYYVGNGHSNYPTAQPISAWTTTAPTQPQM
ncbi:hypothetical protein VTN49DRAFT_3670 [Thermomyces lanuginosus]|uniref:uncharacterized protein n=1 Tax=Thermomyces lanuginosus TaxID=5541 RepID=UPI00374295A2